MVEIGLVVFGIVLALLFDFGNGVNDSANSIATIVSTKVLSFRAAALLAAIFNFIAVFFFTTAVAKTVGSGLIDPNVINIYIILAGMFGAIIWIYFSNFWGLPISASHALIGGLIGAALLAVGPKALILKGIVLVVLFIFIAPIMGMIGGALFSILIFWIFKGKRHTKINNYFKKLQLISSSLFSLSHGANDAQKTIGIITLLLYSSGLLTTFIIPYWVILMSYTTIGLGTFLGGKRVIKTMGVKITKLKPIHGFCAESSGTLTIILCSLCGIPVSTTHVIAGSIVGVGLTKRTTAVRWYIARNIIWAWILTIPVSAFIGAITYFFINIYLKS